MDTTELTAAFRAATADIEPRAGFTTAVVRGSRRRRNRRRLIVVAVGLWSSPATGRNCATGPDQEWIDAGKDAALLPMAARQVQVTTNSGTKVVDLVER